MELTDLLGDVEKFIQSGPKISIPVSSVLTESYMTQAQELWEKEGNDDELMENAKQALTLSLNVLYSIQRPDAYTQAASALSRLQQRELAHKILDRGISKFTGEDDALFALHYEKGQVYEDDFLTDQALEQFKIAARYDPNDIGNQIRIIYLLMQKQETEKALEHAQGCLLFGENSELYLVKAAALLELNRPVEAIEAYTRSIEGHETDPEAYYGRGSAYEKTLNIEAALADYTKSIEFDPNNLLAFQARAEIYTQLMQYENAVNDWKKVRNLALEQGDFKEWITDLDETITNLQIKISQSEPREKYAGLISAAESIIRRRG